jgi:glyoxylase-like metal-dependent hydrolase (beta-lactamase superfamily II)
MARLTPSPVFSAALVLALSACGAPAVVGRAPSGAPIVRMPLSQSSVYLIETRPPVLIDAGTMVDGDELSHDLAAENTAFRGISLVIVTHAHHDHAGLAAELQQNGARIMLGAGDVPAARRGVDDELLPTGLTGVVFKPLLSKLFPEFTPDIVVRAPVDLRPWGVDGQVLPMPGHTPGSLVVLLSNHAAFVGDEMLGGWLGGALFGSHPGEHYYQADRAQNRRNIATLLAMGVETFYLGHGGPVSRAAVQAAFGPGS